MEISIQQAYEWVKTGHWNLAQFREWCEGRSNQMDYTETPGAEDFAEDLAFLVKKYKLKKKVAAEILRDFADDLSPAKKPKVG